MRLIRLTTENENAEFDTVFNQDIIVKPFSKIALQCLSTQINQKKFIINSSNNLIQYTLNGVNPGEPNLVDVILDEGEYSADNVGILLADITNKLNLSMTDKTEAEIGKEWRAVFLGNRVVIECRRGDVLTLDNALISAKYIKPFNSSIEPILDKPYKYIDRTNEIDGLNSAWFCNTPVNKGASSLRCQLYSDSDSVAPGFILGYTNKLFSSIDQPFSINDIAYGVKYNGNDELYQVIENGTILPESVIIEPTLARLYGPGDDNNDQLCIDIVGNSVALYIVRVDTDVRNVLYTANTVLTENNFFPCGFFVGDTAIFKLEGTLSKYYLDDPKITFTKPTTYATTDNRADIPTGVSKSKTYIKINSDLSQYLGYSNQERPIQKGTPPPYIYIETDDIVYLADIPNALKFNSDSFVVELQNINIESYDSLTNQRKNFIAVIPNQDNILERVAYIAPVLLFIDLNNKEPINLRSIKCRILDQGLNKVNVYGLSQLVLLID